jgi:hypothetical protein
MGDNNEVERLKSVIIEHVAKDVLILTETVDKLNEQFVQVNNMLKLLEDNTEKQFDLAAKQITDFLVAQEKHLADIADARTKQISLTVSDNVEKILHGKFETYQQTVDKALDKFERANVAAVESLNSSYKETEAKIREAGLSGNQTENKANKYLTAATLALSAVVIAGIISFAVAKLF